MDAPDTLLQEHEALLQFLYLAPVGLVQLKSDGTVLLLNPEAARLLMPLSRDGRIDQLFELLQDAAPDLQDRLESYTAPTGRVCDGIQIPVDFGTGPRAERRLLSLSLIKVDAVRCMVLLQDITEQVRQEHRMRQQQAWLGALSSVVPHHAQILLDHQGRITEWNAGIGRITGHRRDTTVGRPFTMFRATDSETALGARGQDLLLEADHEGCSLDGGWHVRADGSRYWGSMLITPLPASTDSADHIAAGTVPPNARSERAYSLILRDLSAQQEQVVQARDAAVLDHLTGIGNRRAFFDAAEREIRRLKRRPRPLALVMFDADHFKRINDTLGHATGDAVLRHIAQSLRAAFRDVDVVARIGGEEFAVLLQDTDLLGAHAVAERFCRRLEAHPAPTASGPVHCTVSAGVASLEDCGGDLTLLMQRADQALYAAKAAGRNQVCRLPPQA